MTNYRIEQDSLGEIHVPKDALWGAQTQRAVKNFPLSGITFPFDFIHALALIKKTAALVNLDLQLLQKDVAIAIATAADEVMGHKWDDQFPVDIFQTGSGTSTNMNMNEVLSTRATQLLGGKTQVHPNDHVNLGQSSNDVIPTAIHISSVLCIYQKLIPSLKILKEAFIQKGEEFQHVVLTGRTHLMDAMPISFQQRFSGYAHQVHLTEQRTPDVLVRLTALPQGGTAVGTGINTHAEFGKLFAKRISTETNISFSETSHHFAAQSSLGIFVEIHSILQVFATDIIKIANDIRWMNSGPIAGLQEIQLKALQPGSSIMPGKVNPVIEEAVIMAAMKVIGNNSTITLAAQSGNFELNVALPITAHCLLESLHLLSNCCQVWAAKSISQIAVHEDHIQSLLQKNPILATALNPLVGYDMAAKIVKTALQEKKALLEVAMELCPDIPKETLEEALKPQKMVKNSIS